jgi:hypothetical protein
MNAALTGLLATNTHREDGINYDAIKLEEITEEAEALGLEMFDRFKRWRKEEHNIQRLRQNKKVTAK